MKLYTLIGIPGSGKSTYASNHPECITISTDQIREEINGDANCQDNGNLVFKTAYNRIREALNSGNDVIFDATNISKKYRKAIFDIEAEHIAVYITTDVDECKLRNSKRDRVVPEDVIDKMYNRLEAPSLKEGFSKIIIL